MKQTYFPHDSNARNDIKVVRLRKDLGLEGYGVYFCLLEMLFSDKNMMNLNDIDTLAFSLQCDSEVLRAVINKYNLFVVNDDSFYSARLNETIGQIVKKSVRASENAKKRWNNTNEVQPQSSINTIKLNNSKSDNIKEDKNKSDNLIHKRLIKFKKEIDAFTEFNDDDRQNFYDYWSEQNKSKTRLRFEMQPTWNLKRRLNRWANSQYNTINKKKGFPDFWDKEFSRRLDDESKRTEYYAHLKSLGWASVYSPNAGMVWTKKKQS